MKKRSIITASALLALLFVGAGCAGGQPVASPAQEAVDQVPAYVGTWSRLDTYVNGEAQGSVAATMELGVDSYVSTSICTASGSIAVEGTAVTMTLDSTDCPIGAIPDVYHSTLTVSDDGTRMTLVNTEFGAEVREEYSRK